MASETETVTLRDIALLSGGVTAPAVANWRKRFNDFPEPIGKDGRQPLFDREDVIAWLTANGKAVDPSNTDDSLLAAVANLLRQTSDLDAVTQLGLTLNDAEFEYDATPVHGRFSDEIRRLRTRFTPNEVLTAVIDRLVHSSGRRFDEYRAPARFSALIAKISETPEDAVLYDPCAGLGSTLAAAATSTSALHGQELVPEIAAAARQLLASRDLQANIVEGDTIRADNLPAVVADRVFAVPPLNMRLDDGAVDALDPRWTLRRPKKYDSDVAFIQIALAHLAPTGRAIIHTSLSVLHKPNNVLEKLVSSNQLDAVIVLPAGVAAGANVESCLLVIDRQRPANTIDQQTPVLLAHLNDNEDVRGDISETFLNDMITLWDQWDHSSIETSNARTATLAEIEQNGFNLSPSRYFKGLSWPRPLLEIDDFQSDSSGSPVWFNLERASRQMPSIGTPDLDVRPIKPATLVSLDQLRKLKQIEVIRGDANPRTENSQTAITSIQQLLTGPGNPSPAVNRAEVALTEAGDLIVGLRETSKDISWAQGTRIDDSAWEETGLDALYDLAFGWEAFEADAEEYGGRDPRQERALKEQQEDLEQARSGLDNQAILANSPRTRVGLVTDKWAATRVSRDFVIIRVANEDTVTREYLLFWLASPSFVAHIERYSRTGSVRRISLKDLLTFELPIIEAREQRKALAKLRSARRHLADLRAWAKNIIRDTAVIDSLSVEYFAAKILEEPEYTAKQLKEMDF